MLIPWISTAGIIEFVFSREYAVNNPTTKVGKKRVTSK